MEHFLPKLHARSRTTANVVFHFKMTITSNRNISLSDIHFVGFLFLTTLILCKQTETHDDDDHHHHHHH